LQEVRFSLDGRWEFLHVSNDPISPAKVRSIAVPGVWQAQFPDLRSRGGIGIYRRTVTLPDNWVGDRVYLRFGAVFHNTQVWVNGADVGSHEGGFLPFAFDVTDHLTTDPVEVKVRVESPTDDPSEFPHAPLAEIPFGKQSWYGPLSGIWQSVALERRVADHLARVRVFSDRSTGWVSLHVRFACPLLRRASLKFVITGPDGDAVLEKTAEAAEGASSIFLETHVPRVRCWSPDAPNLYGVHTAMLRDGVIVDETRDTFGFRSIEAREGKLYLNGEPFYLRAALDQDYYPDTICTPASTDFIEDQFRKAKELGLNSLRCHIKVPDPRYYEVADRVGLLIWAELPNGGFSTERSRGRKEKTLKGIVDRDANHPCIFCWTLINENWGVDLVHDAHHRQWVKQLYSWLKAYDPSRLVVDNSPLSPSFHVQTDLADYHFYAAIPDSRTDWDKFVDELAGRADWLFSPEGDAVTTGQEPLICSEFGNWGLPDPEQLLDSNGDEPWWFESGHDWGEGVMYPHGVETRYVDWNVDRVFGDFKNFISAAQWQQFRALKYEIEKMRSRPEIAGYVITELTDVHWESNGLLDMRRNRRIFHDVFRTINADTVVVPKWEHVAYWAGETAHLAISVAHGGARSLGAGTLRVLLDGAEVYQTQTPEIASPAVADLGSISFNIPELSSPKMCRLSFQLEGPDGETLATNYLMLAVHPARKTQDRLIVHIWAPTMELRERLSSLGYHVVEAAAQATIVVTNQDEPWLAGHIRDGGRVLLLLQEEGTLYPYFPHWQNVKVVRREGTPWRGDWASSFSWLRRRGTFQNLPGGPLLDETFDRVIPDHVIAGCNLLDFQGRVHAGLAVGWVHRPVAVAVERGYGRGRILASTFRLFRDPAGADPTATALLDAMIDALATAGSRESEPL
jgi:hypothetical protein